MERIPLEVVAGLYYMHEDVIHDVIFDFVKRPTKERCNNNNKNKQQFVY